MSAQPIARDIQAQLAQTVSQYEQRFDAKPAFAATAPGRVNLIGEHTDYNDGLVLPMAIERQTLIVAGPSQNPSQITLASTCQSEIATVDLNQPLTQGKPRWANYVKGVIAGCLEQGMSLNGFNAMIDTNVPLGGGLSSSASLEVATATLIQAMFLADHPQSKQLDGTQIALLCQKAEHTFANTPCGIMDQFISTKAQLDHAMLLDCRSHETRMVPMTDPAIAVLIINTNVRHELSGGEYGQRRNQCETAAAILNVKALRDASIDQLTAAKTLLDQKDQLVYKRARHVITEIERTQQAAAAAQRNDWSTFGKLMYQSHHSLRDDFEVSCKELDILVEIASSLGTQGGVFGSRMTGGGFGGCTVSIVQADKAKDIQKQITQAYQKQTGIEPAAFVTHAAQGAHSLQL